MKRPKKFVPLGDRVLISVNPPETTTASGIIIPETAKEKPLRGKVEAVGNGTKDYAMTLCPGDEVMFGQYTGSEIKLDGSTFLIMKESEVYGTIETM